MVYLKEQECTYREWNVTEKPYAHALAAITSSRGHNMESFVDSAYSVAKFRATYDELILNIIDRNQWPQVEKGSNYYHHRQGRGSWEDKGKIGHLVF